MEKHAWRSEGFVELEGWAGPSGVYLLLRGDEVLYAGQAINVYQRLSTHYNTKKRGGPVPCLMVLAATDEVRTRPIPFNRVLVKLCPKADLDRLEIALIDRFDPPYNTVHKYDPWSRIGKTRRELDVSVMAAKLGIKLNPSEALQRRRVA